MSPSQIQSCEGGGVSEGERSCQERKQGEGVGEGQWVCVWQRGLVLASESC